MYVSCYAVTLRVPCEYSDATLTCSSHSNTMLYETNVADQEEFACVAFGITGVVIFINLFILGRIIQILTAHEGDG